MHSPRRTTQCKTDVVMGSHLLLFELRQTQRLPPTMTGHLRLPKQYLRIPHLRQAPRPLIYLQRQRKERAITQFLSPIIVSMQRQNCQLPDMNLAALQVTMNIQSTPPHVAQSTPNRRLQAVRFLLNGGQQNMRRPTPIKELHLTLMMIQIQRLSTQNRPAGL